LIKNVLVAHFCPSRGGGKKEIGYAAAPLALPSPCLFVEARRTRSPRVFEWLAIELLFRISKTFGHRIKQKAPQVGLFV